MGGVKSAQNAGASRAKKFHFVLVKRLCASKNRRMFQLQKL